MRIIFREGDKKLRRAIGILLLIVGGALVFYPQIEKIRYDTEQQKLVDSFEQLGQTELIQQLSTSSEEVDTIEATSDKGQQVLTEGVTGIIRIDSIDLEMAIFADATPNSLSKGAGIVDAKKQFAVNNVGLAGHRALASGKQFNRLDEIRENDVIEVTTAVGNLQYEVTRTFVVHKSDVSVLEDQDKPLITLVTCTPLGRSNPPDRLIVQAELKQ